MKVTMKTASFWGVLAVSSTVTAYNPEHFGKLGNTPQPNFANRYQKPKKRGLTPWVSLKQIREGNAMHHDMPPPPPPMRHPYGMPLPFGGTGIPIAPDPNPNDFNEYGFNPASDQQIDEFRHFLFQDMMDAQTPQGFTDFSNEDAWAWKKEHDMPHPGPPPPGVQWNDNMNHMHVHHPMQGPGMDNNNMDPPASNRPDASIKSSSGSAHTDPAVEALERMFNMKAYDKNQPNSRPNKDTPDIPSYGIHDLPGFGDGRPLNLDMDGPAVHWKDEYKFDPTRYRNFDDTIINSFDEQHLNPTQYPNAHRQQQQQVPTPNRRLVRYRPNKTGNRARTDLGAQSFSGTQPNTNFGGAGYKPQNQHHHHHQQQQQQQYRPMQDPNQGYEPTIMGHHMPAPTYRPMQDPNQPFHYESVFENYGPSDFFLNEPHYDQYGPEYVDPAYFEPPPPPFYHPQQFPNYDYDGYYNNGHSSYDQQNGEMDGGLLFY